MALENGQTLEKHAEFFNQTKAFVVDMDDFTLECHIRELGMIAFEARARVLAASEEKRQRSAKKTKEEKEWILGPTGNQINVTDSINGVKERKARQTKAEKDLARLKSLGIDSSIAEALIAEAIRKNTGSQKDAPRTLTDNRPAASVIKVNGNTQESLLADVSTGLVNGINTRSEDDLENAAKTAGHIGNKVLGPHPDAPVKTFVNPFANKTQPPTV